MKKSFLDFSRINSERLFNKRFDILLIILSILTILLISRLYFLQVISYDHFDTLSKTNRIKYIQTPPRRGIIYDRNNVVLADNSSLYSVEINIKEARDIEKIINAIDEQITISKKEINNKIHNSFEYTKSVNELTSILKLGFFNAGYIPVGIGIVLPLAIFTGLTIHALR